jgi:DNA-binding beta-propeller fold protein YncE
MATRLRLSVFLILVSAVTGGLLVGARRGPAPPQLPGVAGGGATLLPNGWTIQPAGTHLIVGGLPLNLVETPDHRYAVITNNGLEKPTLTMVDLKLQMVAATVPVDNAWYGLAWDPDGARLYSAGGAENAVYVFSYEKGKLTSRGKIPLGEPEIAHGWPQGHPSGFTGGLAVSPDGRRLYALQMLGGALTVVDLDKRAVLRRIDLGAEPYAVALSPDASALYVSIWGGAKVAVFDAHSLERLGEIATDEHPNAMVFSKDGRRLFVACANRNTVWAIDTSARKAIEQVSVALFPHAPAGSTPNALALSPDGETLAVANADNNTVALVDVGNEGASEVEGFIPTGWYPTGVRFDQDGRRLLVLSGKGLMSQANPRGPNGGNPGMAGQYSGGMMQGAISFVPTPGTSALAAMTKRVYAITPYTDAGRLAPPDAPRASSIPREVGGASPIRHVFYIIRENRTYDQVLGDAPAGNGDPNLALFGEKVTPNAHAITRQFVLFDNFYVNAEVSYDGHAYSTAAYATDFVEKMWPTNYGGRGGLYLSEGGYERRNAFGNISAPADGYIWDFANRAGVSVRSYGEFAERGGKGQPARATVPGLEGKVCPDYEPWDLNVPDERRVDEWLKEFREFEANGQLPRLNILRLGGDHTFGTRPGAHTPRAMVAENDYALGRIVEAISKSRFWKESAIFVLEDDAQNGPDHVDAHRSVLLVASPFARHGVTDSTLYTTASVLRTMELILGLPPMSQYDAAARPLYGAFTTTPVPAPYALQPAQTSFAERNGPDAPGAAASLRMNFAEADRAPDLELNQVIWESVHGAGAVMPPPVRAAFVRTLVDRDDK